MSEQMALFIDFENVAIWASEQESFEFDVTGLMNYLRGRGGVVIKRAYADWVHFSQYRDVLLGNSVDLIQLYSLRNSKNRADIRLALDAFEIALTHSQIQTIVVVSGDSDFGPLVSKLREYGKYVLGIGPRQISHRLLVSACDEFVYLEAIAGKEDKPVHHSFSDKEQARQLLQKALDVHEQRGEIPVLASRLKQTMLSIDPTFNEVNLGHAQFRSWLEVNRDLVRFFFRDLQLYVVPVDFVIATEAKAVSPESESEAAQDSLIAHYRAVFERVIYVDMPTRRQIMHDIYQELKKHPATYTVEEVLKRLEARYSADDKLALQAALLRVWQTGFYQSAYTYYDRPASFKVPVGLAPEINNEHAFVRRVESAFIYRVLKEGLELDHAGLAEVLLGDRKQVAYIDELLEDVRRRGKLPSPTEIESESASTLLPDYLESPYLQPVLQDIQQKTAVKAGGNGNGSHGNGNGHANGVALADAKTAATAFEEASEARRSRNFLEALAGYQKAARLQLEALERGDNTAKAEDLAWYLASYASVKAGDLCQVQHKYGAAEPYYLAFFYLLKEDETLWERVEGLIIPMIYHYWANIGKEMGLEFKGPAQLGVLMMQIKGHAEAELKRRWQLSCEQLQEVNPDLLRWVVDEIRREQETEGKNVEKS